MDRIIKTELTSSKAYDICRSIMGQMSDGYWENNSKMDQYWRFASVKMDHGNVVFSIDERPYIIRNDRRHTGVSNGFKFMRESEILGFFAKKIKFILRKEFADKKRTDDMKTNWLSSSFDNDICVRDVEDVIRSLSASAISAGIEESSID